MKIFDEKHIKNIALVGAHKSGKTTLAETMLFEAELITRRGSVEAKNTVADFHEIEHEREASVFATPLHTEWRNYKINIIDVPGLDDFIGEITSATHIADTVVMLVNAQHGVEVGTEIIWNYIDRFRLPSLFVVNQIDHMNANFDLSFDSIVNHFGNNAIKIQYPITVDGAMCIIDVLKMKMYKFGPEGGKPEKLAIPDSEKENADRLHNELVEKAAENDEELMELFFDKGTLNEEEMRKGIKAGMMGHELFPVFCVSALNDMGSGRLMGFIDNVAPSPQEMPSEQSVEGDDILCRPGDPTALFVFKVTHEANLGQMVYFKVKSGEIKLGDRLVNSRTEEEMIVNQLFIMDGHERHAVSKLTSGDIGATIKLKNTEINDTLHSTKKAITIKPIKFPPARMSKAVMAVNKRDEEKLAEVIKKLHSQDPTVEIKFDSELRQLILSCQGELHLSVINWLLLHEYGIEVEYEKPKIPYRETIQRSASASYRHKKQSGGSGQYGEVHLKIEPYFEGMPDPEGFNVRGVDRTDLPWGGVFMFYNCIVGGVIDLRFLPSIKKGILEVLENGPITGSYARDIRVMVHDGKMHPVDSNDISFKIAGAHAFKEAFMNARPKLMEPIHDLEVHVPEDVLGDIMTDLQVRRSTILGIDANGNYQTIKTKTPLAEMYQFSTALRSITQGKGSFTSKFAEFAAVPQAIQDDLLKKSQQVQEGN